MNKPNVNIEAALEDLNSTIEDANDRLPPAEEIVEEVHGNISRVMDRHNLPPHED